MSPTNIPNKNFDLTLPPPTPLIFSRPRHAVIRTEEHKVRVTSTLLPDSPFSSSSPPNGEVYIPRLNGARKLHVEQSEPTWMTGACGQPKPVKNLQEADWRKQHPALRAQNLSRNTTPKKPEPALTVINMDPEAFEQDSSMMEYPPVLATHRELYEDPNDIHWPKAMVRGDTLEVVGPSVLREPVIVSEVSVNRDEMSNDSNKCVCASGECCPFQGSSESEEDEGQNSFVFPKRADKKPRMPRYTRAARAPESISLTYDEAISTTYAILNGDVRGRSPDCEFADYSWMKPPEVLDQPTSSIIVPEIVPDPPPKEKGSRMKLFRKGIAFLNDWKKKPKTVGLEERNVAVTPIDRHYEGTMCTPQPSPVSSASDSRVGFYAPSRQNPGPPPLTPPPSPKGKDIEQGSEHLRPSYHWDTALLPTSFNQLGDIMQFQEGLGEPGPSNLSLEDLSAIPQWSHQGDHGLYNSSTESFCDSYSGFSNNPNWPLGNETHARSMNPRFVRPHPDHPNFSPNGSVEILTGTKIISGGCGRRSYPRHNNETSSSRNPENDEIIPNRQASFFNRGIPTPDIECGIKRLPLSNSPIFPGNQGITRLRDEVFPHPGVRKDHQVIGADGVYEMVEFGAVEHAKSELATIGGKQDTQSVWGKLRETAAKAAASCAITQMKTEMRRFWDWLAQKWAKFKS